LLTQVLTAPIAASLRRSYGNRQSQHETLLGLSTWFKQAPKKTSVAKAKVEKQERRKPEEDEPKQGHEGESKIRTDQT